MKIIHTNSFLDGGTIKISCDNHKVYYIDNKLRTKTRGEVYDSYPPSGNIIPNLELLELTVAIKNYEDIEYRKLMLHLLGTA